MKDDHHLVIVQDHLLDQIDHDLLVDIEVADLVEEREEDLVQDHHLVEDQGDLVQEVEVDLEAAAADLIDSIY